MKRILGSLTNNDRKHFCVALNTFRSAYGQRHYTTTTTLLAPKGNPSAKKKKKNVNDKSSSSSGEVAYRLEELVHTQDQLLQELTSSSSNQTPLTSSSSSSAGKKGKPILSASSLRAFSEYFSLTKDRRSSSKSKPLTNEKEVKDYVANVLRQVEEEERRESLKKKSSIGGTHPDANTPAEHYTKLEIFLTHYSEEKRCIYLFSVTANQLVLKVPLDENGQEWSLADEMIQLTNGASELVLIPIIPEEGEEEAGEWTSGRRGGGKKKIRSRGVDREKIRSLIEAHVCAPLRANGLLPVAAVDTMELRQSLVLTPPSMKSVLDSFHRMRRGKRKKANYNNDTTTMTDEEEEEEEVCRAHWIYLRTLVCSDAAGLFRGNRVHSGEEDPVQLLGDYILPRFDVMVVHLVRAGTRSMNLSVWHPQRKRHYHAKGMLSDIIGSFIQTRCRRIIFVPTNRTDRTLLFRCRTALLKTGCECTVVYASDISEKYRKIFQSDPARYWNALKENSKSLDADVLMMVYQTAGVTLRNSHKTYLLESGKLKGEALAGGKQKNGKAKEEGEEKELTLQTNVEEWLSQLELPARKAAEEKQLVHYTKYLVISFTATEHSAFGQPNNATAPQNYILSTAMTDYHGHTLQPWTRYEGREGLRLPSLEEYDVLVVHDAKRFLLFCWTDPDLIGFLKRGGRVWCTQLGEYLLDAQRCKSGSNQLEAVCLKYGYHVPPSSVVGVSKEQLPFRHHREYLRQGVIATEGIFREQLRKAVQQSQLISLAHRMDSLLAMASMEFAGIYIDTAEAERQSKALRGVADALDRTLDAYIPPEVPQDKRMMFDWSSISHMHAYLFGGNITIGFHSQARNSEVWTSNLIHLCAHASVLFDLKGEVHLQRYAAQNNLPTQGNTPKFIRDHLEATGSLKKKKFRVVVFDVETTGLNAATDAIIEIALYDPVENTSFSSLVNPKRPISPATVKIHNLTNAMVKGAPTIDVVAKGIAKYLRLDRRSYDPDEILLLVGHNVFSVDEPMLRRALEPQVSAEASDGILYVDSLPLLRMLKSEMQRSKVVDKKRIDHHLLETLTNSLRLSSLISKLNIVPEGEIHRADTDAKALWFVLVNAFGLTGKGVKTQQEFILRQAAKTLVGYPATGCFVPTERRQQSLQVRLPGVAARDIKNTKLLASLASQPLSDAVLDALHVRGVKVAGPLRQRQRLDNHAARFLHMEEKSLCTLHDDCTVHQFIDMTSTSTSRTVSAYPSCQNIPKDDKSSVRRLFVSRFGTDGRCVEIDYSQLEILVLAVLCNDKNLTRDLRNGLDFHIKRAAFFSGLPYKEIYEGYHRGVPKYTRLRKTAKQFSFQRLYGAGVPLLHKTTGLSVKELTASITAEDKEYPDIARFHRMMRSVALRPNNPGLPTGFIVELPTGVRMNFKTRDVILNLPPLKNYPIQGYGAELAQMMVGKVFRHLCQNNFYGQRAYLTNFVHDSLWLDCHVSVLKECVRNVCSILCQIHEYVPKTFPGAKIEVPFHVSASCGIDMCSMQSITENNDFSFVSSQKRSTLDEVEESPLQWSEEGFNNENTDVEEVNDFEEEGEEFTV